MRHSSQNQAVDKMFWLEAGPLNVNTRHIVWLCRPKRQFMQIIAGQFWHLIDHLSILIDFAS
jgi:hypothetical protein